jgi:large subunit ribosomal protein L28
MALRCENCGKGIMYGHNVSHAKNRTRKIFKPNLHRVKILVEGTSKTVKLCTKCLRMVKSAQKAEEVEVQAQPEVKEAPQAV